MKNLLANPPEKNFVYLDGHGAKFPGVAAASPTGALENLECFI
jgi:hypothetical protein